jgi:hypothetical protein
VEIHHGKVPVIALFRRKIMIVIAKANCLNIHSSVLESPTRLILGVLKRVSGLLLKHEVRLKRFSRSEGHIRCLHIENSALEASTRTILGDEESSWSTIES